MNKAKDLTAKEVAEELGVHIDTARSLFQSGALPGYKADLKQWRITREALDQFKTSGGAKKPGRPRQEEQQQDKQREDQDQ